MKIFYLFIFSISINFIFSTNAIAISEFIGDKDIVVVKTENPKIWSGMPYRGLPKAKYEKQVIDYCGKNNKLAFVFSSHPKSSTIYELGYKTESANDNYEVSENEKNYFNRQSIVDWSFDHLRKGSFVLTRFFCAKSPSELINIFSERFSETYKIGNNTFKSELLLKNRYLFFNQLQYKSLFSATKTWCGEKYVGACRGNQIAYNINLIKGVKWPFPIEGNQLVDNTKNNTEAEEKQIAEDERNEETTLTPISKPEF
jgi:hypothetical protein